MQEFCEKLLSLQDAQLEQAWALLNREQKQTTLLLEELHKAQSAYTQSYEPLKNKLHQTASELQTVFSQVEDYEKVFDRLENSLDEAETNLKAIEEYAYGENSGYFSSLLSSISRRFK